MQFPEHVAIGPFQDTCFSSDVHVHYQVSPMRISLFESPRLLQTKSQTNHTFVTLTKFGEALLTTGYENGGQGQ